MGAIAGANIQVLMLTSMEHDIQAKLSTLNDQKMLLSKNSIFIAEAKSQLYSNYTGSSQTCEIQGALAQIQAQEQQIACMEKQLDMEIQSLQTQLEEVQERKKAEQQRLKENIQGAFHYGIGGGRG